MPRRRKAETNHVELGFEKTLWQEADKLRNNVNAAYLWAQKNLVLCGVLSHP